MFFTYVVNSDLIQFINLDEVERIDIKTYIDSFSEKKYELLAVTKSGNIHTLASDISTLSNAIKEARDIVHMITRKGGVDVG